MSWVITRPYVTLFLCAFLVLATRRFGLVRALTWMATGYLIALVSEATSIRIGIPYGYYAYLYDRLTADPLVFGVPVWDSLSYPFLIYAGWSLATWITPRARNASVALLGALFTMLLDVIIDPVAHLGDQWFLGKIYEYATPGWYFDVPMSNFFGWFCVAWMVITANHWLWHTRLFRAAPAPRPASWLEVGFFSGIALFNIGVTLYIAAWPLAVCSTMLVGVTLAFALARRKGGIDSAA